VWGYVMRQKGDTRVTLRGHRSWTRFDSYVRRGAAPQWFPKTRLTRIHGFPVRLITCSMCVNNSLQTEREVKMTIEDGTESTEFPKGIGKVARRELALNGYTRYEQLTTVTAKQLLEIHGVGPKAIRILEEELHARGMSFAQS
jgi:hypothetical protein